MENKRISIIVPIYNVEQFLYNCLEDLTKISYSNIEFILINDGSTDNSLSIAQKFEKKDSRFKLISQKNMGLSAARNTGLNSSNSDYIFFLDSDDRIIPSAIDNMLSTIEDNNADIVVGNFVCVSEDGDEFGGIKNSKVVSYDTEKALCELLKGKRIDNSAWAKLYRRELFDDISFPVGKTYEDIGTIYKLFLKAKIVALCPVIVYKYLIRSGSISRASFTEKRMDALMFAKNMNDEISSRFKNLKKYCMSREFRSAAGIFESITYKDYTNDKYINMAYESIVKCRRFVLISNVKSKQKIFAIASLFGKKFFHRFVNWLNGLKKR